MRRLTLVLAACAVWLFLFAVPAFADNGPHHKGQFATSLQGSCAGCHRAHSGQAPNLLKEDVSTLCFSCHGSGAPGSNEDVVNGVPSGAVAGVGLRGGGFQFALINTTNSLNTVWNGAAPAGDSNKYIGADGSQATNSHHSITADPVSMWGSGPLGTSATYTVTTNLECSSCHDPHGNGQYRILRTTPVDAPTVVPVYINDVPLAGSYNYSTANYGTGDVNGTVVPYLGSAGQSESALNVAANSAPTAGMPAASVADASALQYVPVIGTAKAYYKGSYIEASSRWCATCHTRYMGYRGSAGNQPTTVGGTADATFKFLHATRNIVDPANPGAGTGVINPITTGQIQTAAVIGCYTSSGITFNGVAVLVGGTSTGPLDCTKNTSGTSGSASVPPRAATTTISTGAPKCITCHVSHGSNATDSLTGKNAETSLVTGAALHSPLLRLNGRASCQNCHTK